MFLHNYIYKLNPTTEYFSLFEVNEYYERKSNLLTELKKNHEKILHFYFFYI